MADSRFADSHVMTPVVVQQLAGGDSAEPVWVSGDNGVTFRINGTSERSTDLASVEAALDSPPGNI